MNSLSSATMEPDVVINSSGASARKLQFDSGFLTIDGVFNVGSGGFTHSLGTTQINAASGGRLVVNGDAVVGTNSGGGALGATSGFIFVNGAGATSDPTVDVAGTLTIGSQNMDFGNGLSASGAGTSTSVRAQRIVVGDNGGGAYSANTEITASGGEGLVVGNGFDGNASVTVGTGSLSAAQSDIVVGKDGATAILDIGSNSAAGGLVTARDIIFGDSPSSSVSIVGSAVVNARNIDMSSGGGMLMMSGGTINLSGNLNAPMSIGGLIMSGGAINVAGTATLSESTIGGTLSANQIEISDIANLSGGGVILANTLNVGDLSGFNIANANASGVSLGTAASRIGNVNVVGEGLLSIGDISLSGSPGKLFAERLVVGDSNGNSSSADATNGGTIDVSVSTAVKENSHLFISGAGSTLTTKDLTLDGGFLDIHSNGVVNVTGTLDATSGEIMTSSGGQLNLTNVTISGGAGDTVEMSGEIAGNVSQSSGTLAPGSSPGLLGIGGNYDLNGGTLAMELGGLTQAVDNLNMAAYDHIDVNGNFIIGAGTTLNILTFGSYATPADGDSFDLWDVTGATTGTFDTINLPTLTTANLAWDTSQLYSAGILSVMNITAVPEPSSLAVVFMGVCGLTFRRRRRDVLHQ